MPLFRMGGSSGGITGHVATAPNATGKPVTNIYYDPALDKMVGEYDDAGMAAGTIVSTPPQGMHAVTNVFFDPSTGRLVGEYDDGA